MKAFRLFDLSFFLSRFFQTSTFIFLFILLANFNLSAQETKPQVSWNDQTFSISESLKLGGMVVLNDHQYVLVRGNENNPLKINLELYDNQQLSNIIQKEIDFGKMGDNYSFKELRMLGNSLYLFSTAFNKKQKKKTLYYQKVNLSNLDLDSPVLIATSFSKKENHSLGIAGSKDQSQLLIYSLDDFLTKDPVRLKLALLDSQMNTIWEKKDLLEYQNKEYKVVRGLLDHKGNAYLICDFRKNSNSNKNEGSILYTNATTDLKEYRFGLDKLFISDLKYDFDKAGNLVAAGLFSDFSAKSPDWASFYDIGFSTETFFNSRNRKKGVYLLQFSYLQDRLLQRVVPFDSNEFTTNNKALSSKGQFDGQITLKDFFVKPDNSFLIALEQYELSVQIHSLGIENGGSLDNNFFWRNAVLVNFKDFKIDWVRSIPKRQKTSGFDKQIATSYTTFQDDNDFYFVFNDSKLNYTNRKNKKRYTYHQTKSNEQAVIIKKLDKNGQWKTYVPKLSGKHSIPVCTSFSKQVNNKEMLLYADFGEYFKMGSMKL